MFVWSNFKTDIKNKKLKLGTPEFENVQLQRGRVCLVHTCRAKRACGKRTPLKLGKHYFVCVHLLNSGVFLFFTCVVVCGSFFFCFAQLQFFVFYVCVEVGHFCSFGPTSIFYFVCVF